MPNWVDNELTISGDKETIAELRDQLSKPYETIQNRYNRETRVFERENVTVSGDFLLWNIVRPLDIEAYLEQPAKPDLPADAGFGDIVADFNKSVAEGMDWYNWNIRNWGTKWELSPDSTSVTIAETSLSYYFQTAWSPIEAALDNLALQYPTLSFTYRFIEEGIAFAGECHWAGGKQTYSADLPINHATLVDFNGECWVCLEEDADLMEDYGCNEYAKAVESLG